MTDECKCGDDCKCSNEHELEDQSELQVKARVAQDPNHNLLAVFEYIKECPKCGEKHFHQLIVDSKIIQSFAGIFDNQVSRIIKPT